MKEQWARMGKGDVVFIPGGGVPTVTCIGLPDTAADAEPVYSQLLVMPWLTALPETASNISSGRQQADTIESLLTPEQVRLKRMLEEIIFFIPICNGSV